MSHLTLILGQSGTGKSTSFRNLPSDETVIINVMDKPLPFRGWKSKYISKNTEDKKANYFSSDNANAICKAIRSISSNRPEIKYLIIDDFGYVLSNEYFCRANEKGYEKFSSIGQNAFHIFNECAKVRNDLYVFVTAHTELANDGSVKIKTIGKMLDEKFTPEGIFTYVFHARVIEGEYKFLTNSDGTHVAKSPMGMFDTPYIDNDLVEIIKKYEEYENEG